MRSRRLAFLVPCSFLLLVPFAPYACLSNNGAQVPAEDAALFGFDAGGVDVALPDTSVATTPDAGQDATVADSSAPPDSGAVTDATFLADAADASIPDTSVASDDSPDDSPADAFDAGSGTVTVVVSFEGATESGVTIVFHDATGAVTGTAVTNGSGSASQVVETGGAVTAMLGTAAFPAPVTIFGVQPGDVLSVTDPAPTNLQIADQTTLTSLPASPPTGTTQYTVAAGGCTATFTTLPELLTVYPIDPACSWMGSFPLLVVPESAAGTPLAGFAFQKGNALAPGGDAGTSIALGGAWAAPGNVTITATNPPATSAILAGLVEVAGSVPFTAHTVQTVGSGTISAQSTTHPGYADFVEAYVQVQGTTQQVVTRMAPPGTSGSATFDLSQLLPAVDSAVLTGNGQPRPTANWSASGSLAPATGILVVLSFVGSQADGGSEQGTWTFVVPPTATSMQAPALPTSGVPWVLTGSPNFSGPEIITAGGASMPAYATARASLQPLFPISPNTATPSTPPLLGANGTILLTNYTPL